MNKKYFLSCILVICVTFMFAGCSSITNMSTYYADGSRSYFYTIAIEPEACSAHSIEVSDVLTKIDELTRDYETTLHTYYSNWNGVTFSYGINTNNHNQYDIRLNFNSFKSYCNFYGITQEDIDSQEPELRADLFTTKVIIQDSKAETHDDLMSLLNYHGYFATLQQEFANEFFGGNVAQCQQFFAQIKVNMVRCYASSNNYHTNADERTTAVLPSGINNPQNTLYDAHLWKCTLANPTPHVLVYYNVIPVQNRVAWYVSAILITIIFGVILTICLINNKVNQQKIQNSIQKNRSPINIVETKAEKATETTPETDTKIDTEIDTEIDTKTEKTDNQNKAE